MISFLKLIRYKNLLMVLLTLVLTKYALTNSYISQSFLSNLQFVLLATSILCITAGGYIINDIFDVKIDKINKPDKVFIGNTISVKNAWSCYWSISIIGVVLGVFLSYDTNHTHYSFIFVFTSIMLYFYSKYFKKIAIIGNLFVSFFVGLSIYLISLFDLKLKLSQ